MSNAYHYQNSFADGLSSEFQEILSLGFNPRQIPNLELWLDSADAPTIVKDGSNKVSQWQDKSGNNNHAIQTDIAKQPTYTSNGINGKPAMRGDGNNRRMDFTHSLTVGDPFTIFIVLKADIITPDPTTGSALNVAMAFGDATSGESVFAIRQTRSAPDSLRTTAYNGGGIFNSGNDNAVLSTTLYDGINVETYKNGSLVDSDIADSTGMLLTGGYLFNDDTSGSRSFIGWISDVLIYAGSLGDEERSQVEQYLIQKQEIS